MANERIVPLDFCHHPETGCHISRETWTGAYGKVARLPQCNTNRFFLRFTVLSHVSDLFICHSLDAPGPLRFHVLQFTICTLLVLMSCIRFYELHFLKVSCFIDEYLLPSMLY